MMLPGFIHAVESRLSPVDTGLFLICSVQVLLTRARRGAVRPRHRRQPHDEVESRRPGALRVLHGSARVAGGVHTIGSPCPGTGSRGGLVPYRGPAASRRSSPALASCSLTVAVPQPRSASRRCGPPPSPGAPPTR